MVQFLHQQKGEGLHGGSVCAFAGDVWHAGHGAFVPCPRCVFGVGGVGGYAVEALARSGIGALDLIDDDKVCLTNLNRQIIATHETMGQYKVEAFAARIAAINPAAVVYPHKVFFSGGYGGTV